MIQRTVTRHTGGPLFIIIALLYIGLIILFAWQTFLFVNWLFPGDQIMMKILMVICFDGMDLVWGLCDLFYHFASKSTRTLVRFGWGISFVLSLLASIFYLVISSMFRFSIVLTPEQVDLGYAITIVAVVFQVVMVTFFLYIEWLVRHPYQDEWYPLPPLPEYGRTEPAGEVKALAKTTTTTKKKRKLPVTDRLPAKQDASTTPLP